MNKRNIKASLYSICLHGILFTAMAWSCFFPQKKSHYKIPGQNKPVVAYLVSESQLTKKFVKKISKSKALNKEVNNNLPYTKRLSYKVKNNYHAKLNTEKLAKRLEKSQLKLKKSKSSKHKAQLAQAKKLTGEQLNQLVILIYKSINMHKIFPESARSLGQTGRVIVSFELQPNGNMTAIHIKKSSGYKRLDVAAINAVRSASPIVGADKFLQSSQQFSVPLSYRLS